MTPDVDTYVPALRVRALTRFYDPLIALTTRERTFKEKLIEQAGLHPGQRVLDLGCGTGTLAIRAKKRNPESTIVGLDGDAEVLERARRKAARAGTEVTFDQGLAQELPYSPDSFDAVLTSLFFHHLVGEAKEQVAAQVARVLRPGGGLHVADWGPPSDPLMAAAFLGVRLLDGFEPTRDNAAGRLPEIFEAAGLVGLEERGRLRTIYGSLVFYSGGKPRPQQQASVLSSPS